MLPLIPWGWGSTFLAMVTPSISHISTGYASIILKQDACSGVNTDLKMTTYVLWCNRQGIQIVNRKGKTLKAESVAWSIHEWVGYAKLSSSLVHTGCNSSAIYCILSRQTKHFTHQWPQTMEIHDSYDQCEPGLWLSFPEEMFSLCPMKHKYYSQIQTLSINAHGLWACDALTQTTLFTFHKSVTYKIRKAQRSRYRISRDVARKTPPNQLPRKCRVG